MGCSGVVLCTLRLLLGINSVYIYTNCSRCAEFDLCFVTDSSCQQCEYKCAVFPVGKYFAIIHCSKWLVKLRCEISHLSLWMLQ